MKVSVSVVTYQQAATARQAIESALMQQAGFPFEVIVGDDASADGTRTIIKDIAATTPLPFRPILHDTNAGDFGLSNVVSTVDAARGDYVAFLDGDDYWTDPAKLQKQADFLDIHPECALCAHRVEHLDTDGARVLSQNAPKGGGTYDVGALIVRNFAPKISTMVRRSALADLPDWYRDTTVASADWLLNVLVGRNGRVGFIDEVMAVHRVHENSATAAHGRERMIADKLGVIPQLRRVLPQNTDDLARLERRLVWKLRLARWSPRTFAVMKQLNGMTRSRPQ